MGGISIKEGFPSSKLFNSPLETGIRALVLLSHAHPKSYDLATLTWLDHLIVHTSDIGGPESLHPSSPYRSGELLVRRRLIEESLRLMRQLNLIEVHSSQSGICYLASDNSYAFVELLRSTYATKLKDRAGWLIAYIDSLSGNDIKELISKRIGRWNIEFQELPSA